MSGDILHQKLQRSVQAGLICRRKPGGHCWNTHGTKFSGHAL